MLQILRAKTREQVYYTVENPQFSITSTYWSIKKKRTTLGLKGGVIFLPFRSSQLMGEKNTWFLISIWKRPE